MFNKVFLFLTYGTLKILDFCPLKILNYVINKRGDNLSDKNCYLLRQLCFYDALQNLDRFLLFVIDFTFLLASLNNRHLLFYIIRKVSIMLPIFVLKLTCVSWQNMSPFLDKSRQNLRCVASKNTLLRNKMVWLYFSDRYYYD